MPSLEDELADAGRRLEPEVKSRLRGLLGGFVRAYLPQTWVFETESGVASLTVDGEGTVRVRPGPATSPDVTVKVSRAALTAALKTGQRPSGRGPAPTVTPHTAKGRTAFDYLRGRLGL